MIDPELRARIIAYNKRLQMDKIKGTKLDKVQELVNALAARPGLQELLAFIRSLKEAIK